MKLPIGMKQIIEGLLKKSFPKSELVYKTIFIKSLVDETGTEVYGSMKERYVHFYSDNIYDVSSAIFTARRLLGDAFSYEISDTDFLPEESEAVDLLLHERSRIVNAKDFVNIFQKTSPEETIQHLLKSTILLTIHTFKSKDSPNAYTCDLTIRPTVAAITPKDQNRLAFPSAYTAVESTLKNDQFEKIVDKNFDSIVVVYNDKATEFIAPDTTQELLNIVKKIVLGDNYKDTLI